MDNRITSDAGLKPASGNILSEKSSSKAPESIQRKALASNTTPNRSIISNDKGKSSLHGSAYHLHLAMVFLLRAFKMYQDDRQFQFTFAMEDPAGGKFDDIMYYYSSPRLGTGKVYIQAKHRQGTDTGSSKQSSKCENTAKGAVKGGMLTLDALLTAWDSNASFSIPMYFTSFLEIDQQATTVTYVLCTNATLDERVLEYVTTDQQNRQEEKFSEFCQDIGATRYQLDRNKPFARLWEALRDACYAKLGNELALHIYKKKVVKLRDPLFNAFGSLIEMCVEPSEKGVMNTTHSTFKFSSSFLTSDASSAIGKVRTAIEENCTKHGQGKDATKLLKFLESLEIRIDNRHTTTDRDADGSSFDSIVDKKISDFCDKFVLVCNSCNERELRAKAMDLLPKWSHSEHGAVLDKLHVLLFDAMASKFKVPIDLDVVKKKFTQIEPNPNITQLKSLSKEYVNSIHRQHPLLAFNQERLKSKLMFEQLQNESAGGVFEYCSPLALDVSSIVIAQTLSLLKHECLFVESTVYQQSRDVKDGFQDLLPFLKDVQHPTLKVIAFVGPLEPDVMEEIRRLAERWMQKIVVIKQSTDIHDPNECFLLHDLTEEVRQQLFVANENLHLFGSQTALDKIVEDNDSLGILLHAIADKTGNINLNQKNYDHIKHWYIHRHFDPFDTPVENGELFDLSSNRHPIRIPNRYKDEQIAIESLASAVKHIDERTIAEVKSALSVYDASDDCGLFQNIDDPGTVCIFLNDAGCGKSTFFTWLAWFLSTKDPTRFVVRLNALEYSTDFERFERSGLQNFDDTQIVRILYRLIHLALFVPNVNKRTVAETDVEREVADRCAQLLTITNGRIVVDEVRAKELLPNHLIELRLFREKFNGQRLVLLLDGFDEIAPNFKDIVLKCFARFTAFEGLRNMYISSRPYDFGDEFEEIFNDCSIFRLQPFSRSDEIISLHKFLLHQLEDYVKLDSDQHLQLLTVLHATVSEVLRDMTTIPLLLHMVLQILLPEIRQYVDFSSQTLSPRLLRVFSETNYDILTLVEHFVDQQLAILNVDKTGTTDSSANTVIAKISNAKLNKQIKRQHVLLAMYVMFDGQSRTALLSEEEQKDASEFMEEVSRAEENTGIVTDVQGGVPQFAHRMFAEYFAACWLFKNKARMRRESIFRSQAIWGYTLQKMREFFDRMILRESDGCELHKAVLDHSKEKLSLLISNNASLITVTDAAGRAPVHLCETREVSYDRLIKATPQAILNAKDTLFEWTALDYAFVHNDIFMIETLLKHGALINIDTLRQQLSSNGIDDVLQQVANYGSYVKKYGAWHTEKEMYARVAQHLLIERQVDIFAPRDNLDSLSVLEFCTRWNLLDLFQAFVSQTGPPEQVLKSMADQLLQLAFENKAHEMIAYLIEYCNFSLSEVNHIRELACVVESTIVKNQMSLFKLLFHQLCVQSRIAFVEDDGIIDEVYNKYDHNVEIVNEFENKCCIIQTKNVKLPLSKYNIHITLVEDDLILEYLLARAVNEGNLPMTSYIIQKIKLPITNRLIFSIMRQLKKCFPYCHANCTPVFNYLLSKTTDLHSVDEEGRNLLHMTVQNGCVYMLPCLFAKGFNLVEMNAKNRWNVFHYLATTSLELRDREVKILYYLLQHTPRDSLDSLDIENKSVLNIAITNMQYSMAIALIQLTCDNRPGASKLAALTNTIERLARTQEPEEMKGFMRFYSYRLSSVEIKDPEWNAAFVQFLEINGPDLDI